MGDIDRDSRGEGDPPGLTRAAAFFDLDRTLMSGSSAQHFVRAAYRQRLVSRTQFLRWGRDFLAFRLYGSTDDSTAAAVKDAEGILRGASAKQFRRMAPEIMAGILPRIYPQMLEEIRRHQDDGRAAFIVSAAGNDLVRLLAAVLDMEGGIGTRYEISPDGSMTGRLDGPLVYGEGKVEAMSRYAASHDLNLADSFAYSDSTSDLPMLRAVGTAVVVNPDAELAAIARSESWQVMQFDKLGRRLRIGGATVLAAALGGLGSWVRRRGIRSA